MKTLVLWVLLGLTLFTILNIHDLRKLLLFIGLISLIRLYTNNMILVLSISLLIFFMLIVVYNLVSNLVSNSSVEYHILNRVKYINNDGIVLHEETCIKEEFPYVPKNHWFDIQQMMFHINKLRPSID
jgi:predicted membrane protein